MTDPEIPDQDLTGFAAIAMLGAALSLFVTGYVFGIANNLFHLPIIGRLYDEPQFRDDTYMQSLRFFAAGPFLLLQGADGALRPWSLFLILAYLSRLLTFVGFLACARLVGVVNRTDRLLFTVLLAFTGMLQGYSDAGGGGLFTNYFTHSEIANGLSLIAIYYAARGRLGEAFAINGMVFFTNAFVAVWNAAPFGFIILLLLWRRQISTLEVLRRGGLGLAIFALLSLPVIVNILHNPQFGISTPVDYRIFLAQYWPFHFLFQSSPVTEKLELAAIMATGSLAFFAIPRRGDVFLAALWGYGLVYAAGIVMPIITDRPVILNLHLLRSSSGIQLFSALGSLALVTLWRGSKDERRSRVFGPLLMVMLCTSKRAIFLSPFVLLASLIPAVAQRVPSILLIRRPVTGFVLAALILGPWPYIIWRNARSNARNQADVTQWDAVGNWARANTRPDAMFLLPPSDLRPAPASESRQTFSDNGIFEYASHRRVWVDFRRGAAVMWWPSYYVIWRQRIVDVLNLSSLDARLAYARSNGIGYVVDQCSVLNRDAAAFRTAQLCVFSAELDPAAQTPSGH